MDKRPGLVYILGLLHQYRGFISWLLMVQMTCAALYALQPFLFQRIVSLAAGSVSQNPLSEGIRLLTGLTLTYVGIYLLQAMGGILACRFSSTLLKNLQTDFFNHLNHLPLQYFQHQPAGEFITRFNSDVSQTQLLVASLLPAGLREIIIIIGVTVILVFVCPAGLTMVCVGIVFLSAVFLATLNRFLEKFAREQRLRWSGINQVLDETVQGIDTLKIFSGEKQKIQHFEDKTAGLRRLSVHAGTMTAIFSPLIDLISKLGGLLLILAACFMIFKGSLTLEQFLLFFFYAGLLAASVSALVSTFSNIEPQLVSAANLAAFFNQTLEKEKEPDRSASINAPMDIHITDMCFSYPGGRSLFRQASISIPAKTITVVQGPSGSGKSTLINLLLKFYLPSGGSIRIGNKMMSRFSREELRKKIAVVTQNHFIFHDTLKANLVIAHPAAGDEEIWHALEKAQLKAFFQSLPEGLHSVLDPRGKGLSGGEKQRISMARLLLKNAPIVILDEPWANLDEKSTALLVDVICKFKSEATILILTNNIPPGLEADRVWFLNPDRGKFEIQSV